MPYALPSRMRQVFVLSATLVTTTLVDGWNVTRDRTGHDTALGNMQDRIQGNLRLQ